MIPIVFDDDGDDVTIPDTIEMGLWVWGNACAKK